MVDMTPTIQAKSDQLTADDLMAGPRTILITGANANEGNGDQPINIHFEGDNGKPFRPCKSMRRVMVHIWGKDAKQYAGKSMTLFRDPKVQWGGMEVGGVRISHMSHMDGKKTVTLQASNRGKNPYTVQPLKVEEVQKGDPARDAADKIIANIGKAPDLSRLNNWYGGKPAAAVEEWRQSRPELAAAVESVLGQKQAQFSQGEGEDDPFGGEAE